LKSYAKKKEGSRFGRKPKGKNQAGISPVQHKKQDKDQAGIKNAHLRPE